MLTETIAANLKSAMLNRDTQTVSVLRMFQSEAKNASIAQGKPLEDADIIQLLRKEIKKRRETAETYRGVNEAARAEAEEQEAAILAVYLPPSINSEVIKAFVSEKVTTLQPLEPKHKGELIRAVMEQFAGQVDGKEVATIVNSFF